MRVRAWLLLTLSLVISATVLAQTATDGYWSGAITREGKEWRVAINIENGSATVDFIDLGVPDLAFPIVIDSHRVKLEKPQPAGRPPIIFDGTHDGERIAGKWSGLGVEGTFSLSRETRKARSFREEEVEFQNGDIKLSGTLLLPTGSGKHPAVVITHGSSPNERSGYRSWARRFVEGGIAALIFDKRGAGSSTGDTRAASMEDLADDALAGLRMLKGRTDIDPANIGVAGHSQGGWIAPLAAYRSKDVAFVIASAAAAVTPAEQSIYHRAGVMRSQGIPESEIEKASKLRQKLYDLNRRILRDDGSYQQDRAAISQELIANSSARWFGPAELPPQLSGELPPLGALRLLFFDPIGIWEKIKVPTYVVWGDKDTVVPVEKSRSIIERAQARAGNKNLTVRIFPNSDHSNNLVPPNGEWDFPRVNTELDRSIVEWTRKIVQKS